MTPQGVVGKGQQAGIHMSLYLTVNHTTESLNTELEYHILIVFLHPHIQNLVTRKYPGN